MVREIEMAMMLMTTEDEEAFPLLRAEYDVQTDSHQLRCFLLVFEDALVFATGQE